VATKYIQPEGLFDSQQYGFAHVAVSEGTKIINIAGQVAWDKDQNIVGKGDIKAQATQALENIKTALHSAGALLEDISSMRIYVVQYQPEHGLLIYEALKSFFPAERFPASTWIGISALATPDFLVEIEAMAVILS
jgi:enamine deaminase RidA (YjgF/YER057c/UK114 family)